MGKGGMFCQQGSKEAAMQKQYLEAGKFVTTHGVTGEIKAYPYCDSVCRKRGPTRGWCCCGLRVSILWRMPVR